MTVTPVFPVVMNPLKFATKAGSVIAGFASKPRRAESAQRLLAYVLSKMPDRADHLHFAPILPEEALVSAKLYAHREAMLATLPKGGVVAEVGTETGYYSNRIVATCEPTEFHLIDIDFGPLQPIPFPVKKHEGDSSTILSGFPPEFFDWLYIDGDHSYAGVTKDLKAAHRVLKPGGFLVCNDYATWCSPSAAPYGVAKAVNELIIAEGYSVLGLAFHPWMLHDILIQKPS